MTSLSPRYNAPASWHTAYIGGDKALIRYAYTALPDAKATVFILPGSSEYIEKYHEVINDLNDRNLNAAVLDWRGHGLSDRGHNPRLRTATDFHDDVAEAIAFINAVPTNGTPRILLAHSMGAHLALRLLHDNPDMFTAAALIAPMQGITAIPKWLTTPTRYFANAMCTLGLGKKWRVTPYWSPIIFDAFIHHLTSCPQNAAMQRHHLTTNPKLPMGAITLSWIGAALNSMHITNNPKYLSAIQTPILMVMAGDEKMVSNAAIKHTAQHLPNILELLEITGAKHEILMETPAIRAQFWHAFDNKIANRL